MNQEIMEQGETFFRVLYTLENTLAWKEGRYRCGHLPPFDWFQTWKDKGSLNPDDYPAKIATGYYSAAARETFLKAATEDRVHSMTDAEAKQICEQDGVFAYATPIEVFHYLAPEGPARAANHDRYVKFTGEQLDTDKAEGGGAVLARVLETDGRLLSRTEFARVHGLDDE